MQAKTKVEKILLDINQAAIKDLENSINKMFLPTDNERLAWITLKYKEEYKKNVLAEMVQNG